MNGGTKQETHICCLCGKVFIGYPNNPEPLAMQGACCNECNTSRVIPERIRRFLEDAEKSLSKKVQK